MQIRLPKKSLLLRLSLATALTALLLTSSTPPAGAVSAPVPLTVRSGPPGARLSAGFVGLGVVAKALARNQFAHTNLADYLRLLGRHGTLRIGGNRVNSFWTSSGQRAPAWSQGEITPTDLRALAASLRGTGWTVILGVPLLHTAPSRSANEARYAKRILGPMLRGIEVGNEPNLYGISEPSYFVRFERAVRALHAAVPGVPVAGPGTGRTGLTWTSTFARDEAAHPDIQLLTAHEYPLSICGHRHPTIAQLLSTGSELREVAVARSAVSAARELGVPAGIDETNSVICWGAPGVSNTYASALWILDYGLLLAQHGVAFANFQMRVHGCKPYLPLCTRAHRTQLFARPELYGLLALRQMGTGRFLRVADPDPVHLRAFAVQNGSGAMSIALDNVGPAVTVRVRMPGQPVAGTARETLLRTTSPRGLAATGRISLGQRRVGGDGRLRAPISTPVAVSGSSFTARLPAHTAAIVKVTRAAR
jgi:hypothetical protein